MIDFSRLPRRVPPRRAEPERPHRYRIGMISPPGWFNFCADELVALSPRRLSVMNTQMRFPEGFDYTLAEIRAATGELRACARALADTGVELIAQVGMPFAALHGWQGGCELEQAIADEVGVPVEMMGLSVPRRFLARGLHTAALSSVYYESDWTRAFVNFLESAGINVVYAGNPVDQGLEVRVGVLESLYRAVPAETMARSVVRVRELAPHAEGVIVAGIPRPMVAISGRIRALAGVPVVGYPALYTRVLERLGFEARHATP